MGMSHGFGPTSDTKGMISLINKAIELLKSNSVITSEQVEKAMIHVARVGFSHPVIESHELKRISKSFERPVNE